MRKLHWKLFQSDRDSVSIHFCGRKMAVSIVDDEVLLDAIALLARECRQLPMEFRIETYIA